MSTTSQATDSDPSQHASDSESETADDGLRTASARRKPVSIRDTRARAARADATREERRSLQRAEGGVDSEPIEVVEPAVLTGAPAAKPDGPVSGGTFRSLKIRNYRLYFTGNVVCQTGTWMNRVAQDWLVLQLTDNNPVALGVATALQFGPTLLLSIWAGTLADRSDKRRLLRWIQVVLGLAAMALGILAWARAANIWDVYVACLVVGTAASLDGPVRQSFVSELVGPGHLTNAVALNALGFNGARIIGPAAAGVLISAFDTGPVMTFSGLSYLAVILGLTLIDPSQLRRTKPVERRKGQAREGLRYIRGRPDLMLVLALLFMVATFGMNFQVTLAIMARIVFRRDAASYGLLSTAVAVGALLGALMSARRVQAPRQRLLIGTALGFGVVEVILGFAGSYYLLAVLLIPEGILMLAFTNAANAMVQMSTAPAMRGRVMGVYTLAFLGGTPLFSPVLGVLADNFGGGAPLVFGGAVSAISALVIGIWLMRTSHVHFQVRASPVPHVHLQNPAVDEDDEHLSETIADSLHRIGGGARRSVRPAVSAVKRAGRAGRRMARRPAARRRG
ncbi:MAG: MFS transporter [Actinomycetota bacterium]|nr:MFS transporter [Actinomycetota bacterium]